LLPVKCSIAVISIKQPLLNHIILIIPSLTNTPHQVVSPFQAILDYEISHSIPPGWINYSISRLSPNGHWQRLERGEISLSPTFFTGFTSDLHNPSLWSSFYREKALLQDPSLPKNTPPLPNIDGEEVFWKMMSKSRDFDPWMYPALKKLRESGKFILAALSNTVIFPEGHEYANPPPERDIKRMFDVFVSSAHVGLVRFLPFLFCPLTQEIMHILKHLKFSDSANPPQKSTT
jgi:hypothetical protein